MNNSNFSNSSNEDSIEGIELEENDGIDEDLKNNFIYRDIFKDETSKEVAKEISKNIKTVTNNWIKNKVFEKDAKYSLSISDTEYEINVKAGEKLLSFISKLENILKEENFKQECLKMMKDSEFLNFENEEINKIYEKIKIEKENKNLNVNFIYDDEERKNNFSEIIKKLNELFSDCLNNVNYNDIKKAEIKEIIKNNLLNFESNIIDLEKESINESLKEKIEENIKLLNDLDNFENFSSNYLEEYKKEFKILQNNIEESIIKGNYLYSEENKFLTINDTEIKIDFGNKYMSNNNVTYKNNSIIEKIKDNNKKTIEELEIKKENNNFLKIYKNNENEIKHYLDSNNKVNKILVNDKYKITLNDKVKLKEKEIEINDIFNKLKNLENDKNYEFNKLKELILLIELNYKKENLSNKQKNIENEIINLKKKNEKINNENKTIRKKEECLYKHTYSSYLKTSNNAKFEINERPFKDEYLKKNIRELIKTEKSLIKKEREFKRINEQLKKIDIKLKENDKKNKKDNLFTSKLKKNRKTSQKKLISLN